MHAHPGLLRGAALSFSLRPATEADFEPLLDLSIRVLRADLERLGRFDPGRRRLRMRAAFDPATMRVIEGDDGVLGCIAAGVQGGHIALHSFYVEPAAQGRGLGAAVLARLLEELPARPVRIEVLKGSRSQCFWARQGFAALDEQDFDVVMERPARLA